MVADEQTAGRGRLQRPWYSPRGAGLYLSVVLRPRGAYGWSLLPLMAALAAHDALLEVCDLQTDIKWPNDILADGRKLCGILAETVETRLGRVAILGIGVNLLSTAYPAELGDKATSIAEAVKRAPDKEALLQGLLRALASRYCLFHAKDGADEIRHEWVKHSSYAEGKQVRIANDSEVIEGLTRGLESDGALRVETESGEIKIVRAGDVMSLRPA